jgi:hypothetical protein
MEKPERIPMECPRSEEKSRRKQQRISQLSKKSRAILKRRLGLFLLGVRRNSSSPRRRLSRYLGALGDPGQRPDERLPRESGKVRWTRRYAVPAGERERERERTDSRSEIRVSRKNAQFYKTCSGAPPAPRRGVTAATRRDPRKRVLGSARALPLSYIHIHAFHARATSLKARKLTSPPPPPHFSPSPALSHSFASSPPSLCP